MAAVAEEHSLEARLSGLDLDASSATKGTIDGQTLLSAFRTEASPRSRALATLALSRTSGQGQELASTELLKSTVRHALSSLDEDVEGYTAALRLLSTLYALDPSGAYTLCGSQGQRSSWTLILPRIESVSNDSVNLFRAELLSSAAAHTASRAQLKGDADVVQWLASAVAKGKEGQAPLVAQRVALIAGLASYKLERGPTSSEQEELGAPSSTSEDAAELQTRHEAQERLLLSLARPHIVSADAQTLDQEESRLTILSSLEALSYLSSLPAMKEAITNDSTLLQKLCSLPSTTKQGLERKSVFPSRRTENPQNGQSSYDLDSTLSSPLRQADSSLQYALWTIVLNLVAYRPILSYEERQMKKLRGMANAKKSEAQKAGGGEEDQRESSPAVDKRVGKAIAAGATQALVSISLAGGRTTEDSSSSGSSISPAVRDTLGQAFLHLTFKQDKVQRGKIAQAGGARALLVLGTHAIKKLSSDAPSTSNPLERSSSSSAASESSSLAPLQALARMCITTSPAILFGSPTNALAALPALATLYLHATSEPLQRFEALLALTNLASLDAQLASAVAKARMALPTGSSTSSSKTNSSPASAQKPHDTDAQRTVADAMEDSILLEDNAMIRRAAVELLCNLAQDESVFKRWTGEEEEQALEKPKGSIAAGSALASGKGKGKAGRRLHLLVALCSPADSTTTTTESSVEPASASDPETTSSSAKETSLSTRLAASGALAMFSSSATCCSHLLALRPRSLNILVRLVKPGTRRSKSQFSLAASASGAKIEEIDEDETEFESKSHKSENTEGGDDGEEADAEAESTDEELESRLERNDAVSSSLGITHARASLAIRGVSVLHSLVSFLQWSKDQAAFTDTDTRRSAAPTPEEFTIALHTLQASGAIEAFRVVALEGARELQTLGDQNVRGMTSNQAGAEVEARGMRGEVTKMAFECLKMLSGMGVQVK
ncbi:hypothetical protein BCV69DRAFT_314124 [Microstroma glucosiphilum]|uniref:UNC-45/Cro1/She4 central domain-containing protein n=1 Tax=Pseudomicrostroma glucosiphilum TaxID=1684307 RepID=A0A316U3J3_9BASI|nr:hypothetical protein BCV69DRAFT_314124 [Pseudomicrostroma glucosiphilum]PWN18923.1 hypothetical protein BCV69DRAFT_314124 [Pseudomicrostroma glucosiphilum]